MALYYKNQKNSKKKQRIRAILKTPPIYRAALRGGRLLDGL
jgi:hypothetical protein